MIFFCNFFFSDNFIILVINFKCRCLLSQYGTLNSFSGIYCISTVSHEIWFKKTTTTFKKIKLHNALVDNLSPE